MNCYDIAYYRGPAEKALGESEEKFRTVANFAYDWEYWIDPEGNYIYISPSCEQLSGYSPEEIRANPHLATAITHPEDRPLLAGHLADELDKNCARACHFDFRIITRDGMERWIAHSCQPVYGSDGKFLGRRASNRNITKRKLEEEALQKTNDELKKFAEERAEELQLVQNQLLHAEKFSEIGKLSASIAHEFNNPIFGIRNVLAGIKKGSSLAAEDIELVDLAIQECDRIKYLAQELKGVYRPTSGVMTPMNIHKVIDCVLLLLKKELKNKKIKVKKHFAADMPKIPAVNDQIKQVLLNILNNAGDAMPKNGGTIAIATHVLNKRIAVQIQDTGMGIKSEDLNHIFDPFFTTKSETKGTGLGLSISYGIIKKHGGRIDAHSKVGKGTIFTIILPMEKKS